MNIFQDPPQEPLVEVYEETFFSEAEKEVRKLPKSIKILLAIVVGIAAIAAYFYFFK